MKLFKMSVLIGLFSYEAFCLAQPPRSVLYHDALLTQFVNFTMQEILDKTLFPASNSNASEVDVIMKIKKCQSSVIDSNEFLFGRVTKMKEVATPDEDASVASLLDYLRTPKGTFYLTFMNPKANDIQKNRAAKLIKPDATNKIELFNKDEVLAMQKVVILMSRVGTDDEMQRGFSKRSECKEYDLSKLIPAKF